MYLKKIEGPRAVTLANGKIITQADLPPAETSRWVVSRKAAVVQGVQSGLISRSDALERWSLSEAELDEWLDAMNLHGSVALKATTVQKHRQP